MIARTLETPDERDGYVLFTHSRTWLRDLDPFARSKRATDYADVGRARHVWSGQRLSRLMPLAEVVGKLGGEWRITRGQLYQSIRIGDNDFQVVADPNCPPGRMYMGQDPGAMIAHGSFAVTDINPLAGTVMMHPIEYARFMARTEPPTRTTIGASLYAALGFSP